MTRDEVAALWQVSPGTVRRWADIGPEAGGIPSVILPGGRRCYIRADIEADYKSRTGKEIVKGR